jgi:repressor LexA
MDQHMDEWLPEGIIRIPLLGEVAAGQPLEVYSVEETLDVPESMWNGRKVFALRVCGQSMIDAGIHDGDYLIVEPCDTADDGRTVVAEIDGRVTVKKIFRDGDCIKLQPANPEMLPLVVPGEDVRVRGVVVGVMRKYGFQAGTDKTTAKRRPPRAKRRPASDDATLDLEINAIDSHLSRWRSLLDCGSIEQRDRVRMATMARDLQALRDWCARTSKPGLRRALITDANQLMRRMHRFLSSRTMELPELMLH